MNRLMNLCAPLALCVAALSACPNNPPPDSSDTTPPEVRSFSPSDGAVDIAANTEISVRFTEDVKADTVELEVTAGGESVAGAVEVDGDTAHFTPDQDLPENAEIAVEVKAGYEDLAGNAGEGDGATFTTAGGLPQVTETVPADGAANVAVNVVIRAVFSEAMDAATFDDQSFTLKDGMNAVAGTVAYDDQEHLATFTPAQPLLESRTYVATLTTAIKDMAGNALEAAKIVTFTTQATVPSVVSITPQDGSTLVAGNAPVQVEFSEEMDAATLTDQTLQVSVQGGAAVPGTITWDSPSRTATFQPTGAYPGAATIDVLVTTGAKDASGIALGMEATASFTISPAPSVTASTPAPNDVDVPLDAEVTLTFSEAMDVATLTPANVYLEDPAQTVVAANYVPSSTGLTLTPNLLLEESTAYTLVVTPAVTAATGVPFAMEYRFTFNTLGIAPAVVQVTPAPGATDVPISSTVRLVFSEPMDPATVIGTNLRLSDGAADVAGTVTVVDPVTADFAPAAPLLETASYTVIAGPGLHDLKGNGLQGEFRSSFVTEPLPRIVSITPAPNTQDVPAAAAVVLVANKDLDPATVTITPPTGTPVNTVTLYEDGAVTEGAITWDATTRAIRITRTNNGAPAGWANGKRYLVEVDGAMLLDTNGNAVGGKVTTTFVAGSTTDTTAPSVLVISPQNGETGVTRAAQPFAVFTEDIDPTSLSAANVHLKDGATDVPGRIEYVQAQHKLLFVPDAQLPADTQLTFTVGAGVKDPSGNQKTMSNVVTFTTQENSPAQVVAVSPADQEVDVEVNRALRLVFSEGIDRSTLVVEVSDGTNLLPGGVSYDDASRSALFLPSSNWPGGTALTVTVKAGLADKEGAMTTADVVSTFTTVANLAQDVLAPTVSASNPAAGATGVSARPQVTVTFSEPMDPGSITLARFTLQEQGGNKVPFGLAYDAFNETATLTPSLKLAAGTVYEVKLQAGLLDLAGNALDETAASATVAFTVDGTAPAILTRSPTPTSTVGASSGVELVFDEDMDAATLDASSLTLSDGAAPVRAAVWYEPGTRTAFLRPAARLTDGTWTVTLDGTRAADLAGNTVADTFSFTVSTASPSVVSATPCGQIIDPDDFGSTVVTVTFDPGVESTSGASLDDTAVQLRVNGTPIAAPVTHTQGGTVATLAPATLTHDTTYEVFVDKDLVRDAATQVLMSSDYSCTFQTKRIVFEDDVDPPATGWTNAAAGSNQWTTVDSTSDDPDNQTQVWRGGNMVDGTAYARVCDIFGGAPQTVRLERDVNLFGLASAELRLDERHDIGADPQDAFRISIVEGGVVTVLETLAGTQAQYQRRSWPLDAWLNKTVKVRFDLFIDGGNSVGSCAAGAQGALVDNVRVVGR